MQINTVKRNIQSSGLSNSRATFSSALNSKLFDILAGLYTNIPDAIVRELIANGLDANKEAGNSHKPLYVHIPTRLEPFFSVRDYGMGITHEFMMKHYPIVGFSSKDGSNDLIGGFGIGRISALAYTDSYTVECINNGEQRIYTIFKNEDGLPDVVQMGSTTFTDEPSGTTVKVAVKDQDVSRFYRAANERFQWYTVTPDVNDTSVIPEPIKWTNKTNLWGKAEDDSGIDCVAVMGEIAYRVNVSQIADDTYNHHTRNYLSNNFVMFFGIGELSIAPNREELQYDDHTIDKIRNRVKQMQNDVVKTWQDKLDKCTNLWDARKTRYSAYHDTYKLLGNKLAKDAFTYQGKAIHHEFDIHKKDNRFRPYYSKVFSVPNYKLNNNKTVPLADNYHGAVIPINVSPTTEDNMRIYVSTPDDKRLNSRLCRHVQDEGAGRSGNSWVIKANSEDDKQEVFNYLHNVHNIPKSMFVDVTKEVDDYKIVRASSGGTYVKSTKPQNVYRMKIGSAIGALDRFHSYQYNKIHSQNNQVHFYEDVDIQNESGVYVTVKGWEPYHGDSSFISEPQLKTMLQFIKEDKAMSNDDYIYFVTKGGKDPLKGEQGWQHVYDYCKDATKKITSNKKQYGQIRSAFKARNFQDDSPSQLERLLPFEYKITNKTLLRFLKVVRYIKDNESKLYRMENLVQLLQYFSGNSNDEQIDKFKEMTYLSEVCNTKFERYFEVLDFPYHHHGSSRDEEFESIVHLLNGLDS